MIRIDDWAEPSLAARREAKRLGIAIAAIIPMIATTMRSSISEKPSWRLFLFILSVHSLENLSCKFVAPTASPEECLAAHNAMSDGLCLINARATGLY